MHQNVTLEILGGPVDLDQWGMVPVTSNQFWDQMSQEKKSILKVTF